MRICVFGDIHGNAPALAAALEAMRAEDPDLYACTGDVIFGWGQPARCVDAVRALGCPWVTGNADQTVMGAPGYELRPDSPLGRRAASDRERLGAGRVRILGSLPAGIHLHFREAGGVWLAHGTPPGRIEPGVRPAGLHEWHDNVTDDANIAAGLGSAAPGLFLCGHTHVPTARRIGATLVVNPGSVGYGIHHGAPARYQTGNASARYAVVEWSAGTGWTAHMRRVPYDTDQAVTGLEGLPWVDAAELDKRRAFLAERPAVDAPDPIED